MPIFDLFFVVFPFFRENFSLLMAAPISLKKSNRAKVDFATPPFFILHYDSNSNMGNDRVPCSLFRWGLLSLR